LIEEDSRGVWQWPPLDRQRSPSEKAATDKMALRSILVPYPPYPLVGRERSRPNGRLQCFWQLSHPNSLQ
jgi:hypothetical protein